jgi:cell division protein FtsB
MSILTWIEANLSILWLISAIVLVVLLVWLVTLQIRLSRLLQRYLLLMRGGDGKNLEQVLDSYMEHAQTTAQQVERLDQVSRQLENAAKLSLQHLGVVRFDAFPDISGQQSYAVALVDGHGNGVVMSSIAGRQITRTYAKPLKNWETTYTLSDEEKQAIAHAYRQRL